MNLVGLVCTTVLLAAGASGQAPRTLDVMTFNLRYAHTTPPNLWPARRPVVKDLIARWSPDVIGTQEGLYTQLRDMEADLPTYDWIGIGREGGSRGEFMAIFYKKGRLEPIEYDHYWLSDTPSVIGSRTWGNAYTRMVTSVRFRDRSSGRELVVINTHFDHQVQLAREKSAALLLERAQVWGPDIPVILLGDFNAAADTNVVHSILTSPAARFVDSWRAGGRPDSLGTFHDFKGVGGARGGARIDWILTRGPVAAVSSEIITYSKGAQLPSDHFPVIARLRLSARPTR